MRPVIVLASKSAIRADLLRAAGLEPTICPADIDERALEAAWSARRLPPADVARSLAEEKAKAVSLAFPQALVIGADQTMALGEERFTKAADLAAAREKLLRLRGCTHHLHSAYAIAREGAVLARGVASASLTMRAFDDSFLDGYLARAGTAILASVGCYQLEHLGVTLFERIEGDYFTILGLPLLPLLADLRGVGLDGL
jgi:septum formation protein